MTTQAEKTEFELTLPYPIELVWEAITRADAITQWCMETNFQPVVGYKFQYRAKPNMAWRGWVDCEVLEVARPNCLRFSWQSMSNQSATTVTYKLASVSDGTHIKAEHAGFNRSHGWFSGWLFRMMLSAGLKRELSCWLPQVLENGKQGDFGEIIDRSKK